MFSSFQKVGQTLEPESHTYAARLVSSRICYLLNVLVKLPLYGSYCCFWISDQSRPAKCKVCVAT